MPERRILHLEDNASDALLIQRTLSRAGIRARYTLATDAAGLSAALASEAYDLVLADNNIPGMDTVEALHAVRERFPGIPFITVSGARDEECSDRLLAEGASACALKSHPAQFISAVRQALEQAECLRDMKYHESAQAASARLVEAVQQLSHARDFDSIRRIVRHAARALTGADGATLVLRDGEQCHYVDEDAISPLWKGKRFPLTACISGWAMLHRESVAILDIYSDSRIPADAYRPTFVKSLLMVPIRSRDPIGAIGNYWAESHRVTPREIELLEALANTTAVALENVRIYAELEQRVRERTLQLEAANNELETFSFSVSHDLRAPLRTITGYAELLTDPDQPPSPEESRAYLLNIRRQTERMGELIEDFLRLSHVTRADLHRETIDLVPIATAVVDRLRAGDPSCDVTFTHPPSLPATGDPRLLQSVFENLLSNAWKYTGRLSTGARVELGVAPSQTGEARVFFIRDNGAGFDPRLAEKLFVPFQRLHSAKDFPGSGIGLATVKRIINKHGGHIRAESKPGEGAAFFFTLEPDAAT